MGWGSLLAAQQIVVKLDLLGSREYQAKQAANTRANVKFAASNEAVGASAVTAGKRLGFMQNQLRFTARRLVFYTTLTAGIAGAAVAGLGLQYYNAVQQTRVALGTVIKDTGTMNKLIHDLFLMAAYTPFQIKDIATQFKSLYIPMSKFGYSTKYVQDLLLGMMNSLAAVGRLSGPYLQRAAVQIIHLVSMGRPMGQVINALMRDNIPVYQALQKQFHMTAEQIANIATSGLTARQVLDAIKKYQLTEPGYKNQALLSQTKTLVGAWSTFKDLLSQASAGSGKGLFDGIKNMLRSVDNQLIAISNRKGAISMEDVAKAFDRRLTPSTHLLLNAFYMLSNFIKGLVGTLYLFYKAVEGVAYVLNIVTLGAITSSKWVKILGYWVGISVGLWVAWKIVIGGVALAIDIAKLSLIGFRRALILLVGPNGLLKPGTWKAWGLAIKGAATAMAGWYAVLTTGNVRGAGGQFRKLTDFEKLIKRIRMAVLGLTAAEWLNTYAVWANNAAWYANPLTWIIVGITALTIGLVVLYFKWKAFHDFINRTYAWLKNHPYAALLIPVYGWIIYTVIAVNKLYDAFKKLWDFLHKPLGGSWISRLRHIADIATAPINPFAQAGRLGLPGIPAYLSHPATIGMGGRSTQNRQSVRRSNLSPNDAANIMTVPANAQTVALAGIAGGNGYAAQDQNIKIVLRVDGKDLAEVVSKHRNDRQARR